MAAQGHVSPPASYAVVACDRKELHGIHSATVSAAGAPRKVVLPGDGLAFERMVFAAASPDVGGAESLAMSAREQLFDEKIVHVTGSLATDDGAARGGDEREGSILFYEPGDGDPDDPKTITPWTEVVPNDDGTFEATLPAGRAIRARVHALGRAVGDAVDVAAGSSDAGAITVPAEARLTVTVQTPAVPDPIPADAEVIVVPLDPETHDAALGTVHGFFDEDCAPYLGPPHGAAPACNRAIPEGGVTSFEVAPGRYRVYAAAGPESELPHEDVDLEPGEAGEVLLEINRIPDLRPSGSLEADLHVHSGRSFDGSFPLEDRVRTFVAAGVDVLAATDHDVVTSYADTIDALGVADRLIAIPGVETTGHVPWLYPPGSEFPVVIGHYNFWPMPFDDAAPRSGMPWDEMREPGALFDWFAPLLGAHGIRQLNHPLDEADFGRDTGFLTAIGWDAADPLPPFLLEAPSGGRRNLDHDAQEVMNGADVLRFLRYRIAWHAFLSNGVLRTGTANSDTHGLAIEAAGYPRNVVLGVGPLGAFDLDAFDDAIRAGHSFGTNGPMLDVTLGDAGPSLRTVTPEPDTALHIVVRAAPWVPVDEVRVIVDGAVAAAFEVPGTDAPLRFEEDVPLADLGVDHDAWIVVEAGLALPLAVDTDGDGVVDRIDGNGDGAADEEEMDAPEEGDPRFDFDVVTRGGWPTAFTNPFVIDLEGNGWEAPGS
jgi:hypothetical protein